MSGLLANDLQDYFFRHGHLLQLKLFERRERLQKRFCFACGHAKELNCPIILLQASIPSTASSLTYL